MKINNERNQVSAVGIQANREFQIKQSPLAFKILSDKLYTNKIKAIIQELSCNAVDSHIASQNKEPFEVHLPNVLEPYFSIQDYGIGLTQEEVYDLYTTYFSSSKVESNDYVGQFGLGSKTPFSYTEHFSIISIKDGIKMNFNAYIDTNGTPNVALFSTENTDEHNGLTVSLPVNKQDMNEFRIQAQEVYKWFEQYHPIIKGNNNYKQISYKDDKLYYENEKISVYYMKGYSTDIYIKMGIVGYRLRYSDLPKDVIEGIDYESYKHLLNFLNGNNKTIIFNFDIGEVDVTVSRESVDLSKKTINALISSYNKLYKDYIKNISDIYKTKKTLVEKLIFIREHITYNKILSECFLSTLYLSSEHLEEIDELKSTTKYIYSDDSQQCLRSKRLTKISSIGIHINYYDVRVFILDEEKYKNKLKYHVNKHEEYIVIKDDEKIIKKYKEEYGFENIIRISKLPEVITKPTTKKTTVKNKNILMLAKKFKIYNYNDCNEIEGISKDLIETKIVYVCNKDITRDMIARITTLPVIFINRSDVDKIINKSNCKWVNIDDYLIEKVKKDKIFKYCMYMRFRNAKIYVLLERNWFDFEKSLYKHLLKIVSEYRNNKCDYSAIYYKLNLYEYFKNIKKDNIMLDLDFFHDICSVCGELVNRSYISKEDNIRVNMLKRFLKFEVNNRELYNADTNDIK